MGARWPSLNLHLIASFPRQGEPEAPQCGFSSTEHGNAVTPADQEAKMRHVVATASAVWG